MRTARNLLLTMGLGGLWHGAGWNFALWGISHGLILGLERVLSEGMLEKARGRLSRSGKENYSLSIGNAAALEIGSDAVDVQVNNYMFDLISFGEMDGVLEEFWRVLKPGGKLVLVNMTKGRGFGGGVYDLFYRMFPKAMGGCRGVELAGRLERKGFRVERREYVRQMMFPSEVILARKEG